MILEHKSHSFNKSSFETKDNFFFIAEIYIFF